MAETSSAVVALTALAVAAIAFASICSRHANRIAKRALLRVERERPDEFADIPGFMRRFAKGTVAIRYLKRTAWSGFIDAELDEIRRLERRQIIAVLVGLAAICAAIAGSRWWGWNWG